RIGERTAVLYGVNTLGAVAGVFATAFVLFPLLGLWRSNALGALLDVAVGVLALATLARRVPVGEATATPAAASDVAAPAAAERTAAAPAADASRAASVTQPAALLLAAYATVGFTALVYEVCWTRALALVLGSSIYAFSAMLGAFLAGIALGSLAARRIVDRTRKPAALLAGGLAVLGGVPLAVMLVLPLLPAAFLAPMRPTGPAGTR